MLAQKINKKNTESINKVKFMNNTTINDDLMNNSLSSSYSSLPFYIGLQVKKKLTCSHTQVENGAVLQDSSNTVALCMVLQCWKYLIFVFYSLF